MRATPGGSRRTATNLGPLGASRPVDPRFDLRRTGRLAPHRYIFKRLLPEAHPLCEKCDRPPDKFLTHD
jgi:hypothetical protein